MQKLNPVFNPSIACSKFAAIFFLLNFLFISSAYAEAQPLTDPAQNMPKDKPVQTENQEHPASPSANSTKEASISSLDFLMGGGGIETSEKDSQETLPAEKKTPELAPETPSLPGTEAVEKTVIQTDYFCGQIDGHSVCTRTYSDGSYSATERQDQTEGNEIRSMTSVTDYDADRKPVSQKKIYHGTQYTDDQGRKVKEFEFFEIMTESKGQAPVKEILIYDYYVDSGEVRKISWGKYESQPGLESPALAAHATLNYDAQGKPEKGLAVSSEYGNEAVQFLSWDRASEPDNTLDLKAWQSWESWIATRQLSIYLS